MGCMPDAGGPGPPEYDDDEDDWFGEGTAFDSGEDLAAALFSLAGVPVVPMISMSAQAEDTYEPQPPAAAPDRAAFTVGGDAFQVVDRPVVVPKVVQTGQSSWTVRPQSPGTARTSWGMRHSMQFLKTTEEVIKRLRNEAAEVTWQAAAIALAQANPPPKTKNAKRS